MAACRHVPRARHRSPEGDSAGGSQQGVARGLGPQQALCGGGDHTARRQCRSPLQHPRGCAQSRGLRFACCETASRCARFLLSCIAMLYSTRCLQHSKLDTRCLKTHMQRNCNVHDISMDRRPFRWKRNDSAHCTLHLTYSLERGLVRRCSAALLRDGRDAGLLRGPLCIRRAEHHRYSLPLRKSLTTGAREEQREGFLLRIDAESASGAMVTGIGEIAPLPGQTCHSCHQ